MVDFMCEWEIICGVFIMDDCESFFWFNVDFCCFFVGFVIIKN